MAHTIRRKNVRCTWDNYPEYKFHGDTRPGFGWRGAAPKGFRKSLDRSKKVKEKMQTRKILKTGDYDNYSYNPRKKDAGWFYW